MAFASDIIKGRRKSPFYRVGVKTVKTVTAIAVTMLGLLFVTFFIGRVMPIDPVLSILGERASQEMRDAAYVALGLNKPLIVQFSITSSILTKVISASRSAPVFR
jgi:peptide/nickel transport system permease protein